MDQKTMSQEHRIFIAGFGGQGILTLGKLLCLSAMNEGKQVTHLPSYGAEVRGGTAHCHVVISPTQIFSPLVEEADSLIILNELSFERFGNSIKPGGLLVLNSSLADAGDYANRHEVTVLPLPATERATEMGNVLVANAIMLGAFTRATRICRNESVERAFRHLLTGKRSKHLEINLEALRTGVLLADEVLQCT